ncbi:LamG-like jellyroll fold domain-containing protein [Nocardioides sp. TF02-7]|uniref:LamG-like jellyroll fold domain-containing protein n=1 Tax=Nocardioides sp. TF02-7 TaxID=2917724 RepID=UPI001F06F2A5|nr:LamG-like jellyroll fold domain-containing protein [Nocardioides sp. TF02-7]UMG94321.1 Ig-like domain repeat protein [Nocardioides sp. TF02-7]
MFELDTDGEGEITHFDRLPTDIADQGPLGRPVGATSTAAMYRPGKILQVGGGHWVNGGGPAGARAGFTVDLTGPGGVEDPIIEATSPMEYQRHWPTATVLPNGDVMVSGGSRDNNGNGGYVTNAEIWNPDTDTWTTIEVPYEHARLYHSAALLLPDGRVMIGGGGVPGPRNYRDVEYYSPAYLFDGDEPAVRPEITKAPKKLGYDGTFEIQTDGPIERVTLVRNGSVTHGFNNDQNFQDLEFSQNGNTVSIDSPVDSTYAPPGSYMLFVFDADGTPSVAKIVDIDPEVRMDQRTPKIVDQFEYPKLPTEWRGANPPMVIDVAPGNGRMAPWEVTSQVQLVRGASTGQGGLGLTGYQLALGSSGDVERTIKGLSTGRDYRVSFRMARDNRSAAGLGDAVADLTVGSLTATLTATSEFSSQTAYDYYVGTFTADQRSEVLRLKGSGEGAGLMIDDLVVIAEDPETSDIPVHYEFEEGEGSTAANTGTDTSVDAATLVGDTGWSENGVFGSALDLVGGENTNTVDLPDNLLQGEDAFTTSFWVRPDTKGNWINLFHIGDGLGDDGSFFQIQMQTQARNPGNSGLAATFKAKGSNVQERVYATPTQDVTEGQWNHVVFVRDGATGTLFLNGVEIASRDDLTIDMTDVGPTANNWLGRNGYPDPAYDGLMDDVRVYTSALTSDDVAAMYDEGSALRTTTTVSVDPASPSPFGEPVTVSATVDADGDAPVEGSAELWIKGSRVGTPVEVVDGTVTFPEVALSSGDHAIEVRFTAADGWRDSVGTLTHTVERPPVGEGVPVHYTFDEGAGTTADNTGLDSSIGEAQLQGAVGWSPDGKYGSALSFPGGDAGTGNHVRLPDNIEAGLDEEFSTSLWLRPNQLPQWVAHLQIGSSTDTFFLLQSNTNASGPTGFAATFKAPGTPGSAQERLILGPGNDIPLNEWTHVVFTMSGSTGKLYFNGELVGTREDFTVSIGDVGVGGETTMNLLGGTSWPDQRYNGLIDDFRLYGYELSDEQVEELFNAPPPNVAPEAADDAYDTTEGNPLEVPAPGVLDNDTDADGDDLTATNVTQPDNGDVTLDEDGSFTYTPDAGFSGTDTFTYTANDGSADSAPATVTITVEAAPEPVETTITASVKAVTYGKRATVVATVSPDAAGGEVTVSLGAKELGSADLVNGTARVKLPAKPFAPGKRQLTVSYAGDDSHEASSTTVALTVQKVAPKLRVQAPKAIKRGKKATVKVALTAPNQVRVAGKVRITVNGKKAVRVLKAGKVTVKLPKAKAGKIRVKVVYTGSKHVKKASKTVVIKVKR